MFLDDPFKHGRGAGMIPGRPRPDHGDRPQRTDPQAANLVAQHAGMATQPHLTQPLLQEQPGFVAQRPVTALGFVRIGAEEDLPARSKAAQPGQLLFGRFDFS